MKLYGNVLIPPLPRRIVRLELGVEYGSISTASRPASFPFGIISGRSLLFHSFTVHPAEQHHIPLPSAFTFIMIATLSLLLSSVALSFASPLGPIEVRTVAALNTAAFEEAQQRDDTESKRRPPRL